MDACEYCGGHTAVRWDLTDGDICEDCHERREARRKAREAEQEREAEMAAGEGGLLMGSEHAEQARKAQQWRDCCREQDAARECADRILRRAFFLMVVVGLGAIEFWTRMLSRGVRELLEVWR